MGRGKDLTNNERATVHTLMKKNWNYEQNQFKHKGRSLTLKECETYGVRLSEQSLKRYAAEMKAQEEFDESWFYVSQTKFKVLLIEDMDVLIALLL